MASKSSVTPNPEQQQQQPEEKKNQDQKTYAYLHTWASVTFLVLILLLFVSCLVIRFKINPRPIKYTVVDAVVRDFAISSSTNTRTNDDEHRLRSTFMFRLYTYNPNHLVTLQYESINMTVEYGGHVLAFGFVQPFVQYDKEYRFNMSASAWNVTLLSKVEKDMMYYKNMYNRIQVDVKMHVRASFMVPHWGKARRKLKVVCPGVLIFFTELTVFDKKECEMEL